MSVAIRHRACSGVLFYYAVPLVPNMAIVSHLATDRHGQPVKINDLLWGTLPVCPHCRATLQGWSELVSDDA